MPSTTSAKEKSGRPSMDSKAHLNVGDDKNNAEKHTTYFMKIEVGSKVHTISKRYTEFLMLHQRVREEYYPEIEQFEFPTKVWLARFSDKTITYRRQKFEEYLKLLFTLAQKHRKIKALLDHFLGTQTPSGRHRESRQSTVNDPRTRNSTPSKPLSAANIGPLDTTTTSRNTLANIPMASPVVHNEIPLVGSNVLLSSNNEKKESKEEVTNSVDKTVKKEKGDQVRAKAEEKKNEKGPHMIPLRYLSYLITIICINISLVILFSSIAYRFPENSKPVSILLIAQSVVFGCVSYQLIKTAQSKSF